jgi:hypothetical protein
MRRVLYFKTTYLRISGYGFDDGNMLDIDVVVDVNRRMFWSGGLAYVELGA